MTETIASVERGDVVKVRISGGKCVIEGNVTSPSASSTVVERVVTGTIGKTVERLDRLEADVVVVNDILYAAKAIIDQLDVEEITAATAYIDALVAEDITAETIIAEDGRISNLEANSATITDLNATNARVTSLFSGFGDISSFQSDSAFIEFLDANYQTVNELEATLVNSETMKAAFADINFANVNAAVINQAKMQDLVARSGWFEEVDSQDGRFTGKLTSVILDGDTARFQNIYANALKVLGDDGLYHVLNFMKYDEAATYTLIQNPSGNPYEQHWFVKNDYDEYVRSEDTTVRSGINYYSRAFVNSDTAAYWSRYGENLDGGLHGSNIIAETITATQINVSTLIAAMMLTKFIQIGSTGGTHIESNGNRLSFFTGGTGWDYINVNEYYMTVPTAAGSPRANGYYESDADGRMIATSDESVVSGKTYKIPYKAVSSPQSGSNPKELAWFEFSSTTGKMSASQDTSVQSGKTYYEETMGVNSPLDGEVAYIAVDETGNSYFYIMNEIIVHDLRFGPWKWKTVDGTRNLVLKWVG